MSKASPLPTQKDGAAEKLGGLARATLPACSCCGSNQVVVNLFRASHLCEVCCVPFLAETLASFVTARTNRGPASPKLDTIAGMAVNTHELFCTQFWKAVSELADNYAMMADDN